MLSRDRQEELKSRISRRLFGDPPLDTSTLRAGTLVQCTTVNGEKTIYELIQSGRRRYLYATHATFEPQLVPLNKVKPNAYRWKVIDQSIAGQ